MELYCHYQSLHSHLLSNISVIIATINLIITLIIGWSAHSNGLDKSHQILRNIFNYSLILCLLYYIASISMIILCFNSAEMPALIAQITTYILYFTLIMGAMYTLFTRLKFAFNGSVYQISKMEMAIFNVLFVLLNILFIITIIVYAVLISTDINLEYAQNMIISVMFFVSIDACLYLLGSIWIINIFRGKLWRISELQSNIMTELIDGEYHDDIDIKSVGSHQITINRIIKYISLFILSGSIAWILIFLIFAAGIITINNISENNVILMQFVSILIGISCIVILFCLYLQYTFSIKQYKTYCKYFDCCMKVLFINKDIREIRKQYLKSMKNYKLKKLEIKQETESDEEQQEQQNRTTIR